MKTNKKTIKVIRKYIQCEKCKTWWDLEFERKFCPFCDEKLDKEKNKIIELHLGDE